MVLGHSSLPGLIHYWIFTFHMPLFFILSGMTTNWTKNNIISFTWDKFKKLGIPFALYSAACLFIVTLLNLSSLSWSRGWGEFALWFVPVLFVTLVTTKLIYLFSPKMRFICLIALPILSIFFKCYHVVLPWNMSTVPYASFFILFGSYLKDWMSKIPFNNFWFIFLSFSISVIISLFWHLDMAHNQCVPIIQISVGAIVGTLFIFSVSRKIDEYTQTGSKINQYIGRNTFVILAFSQVIIMTLNKYWQLNGVIKYSLLVVALFVLIIVKNKMVNTWKSLTLNN